MLHRVDEKIMMYVQSTVVRITTLHINSRVRVHFKPQNAYPLVSFPALHNNTSALFGYLYDTGWPGSKLG